MLQYDSSIRSIRGVGDKKAQSYQKLSIETVGDLLFHIPRSYIDLRELTLLDRCQSGDTVAIKALVVKKSGEQRIRKGLSIFKVSCEADGYILNLTFYNAQYTVAALRLDEEYIFYGTVNCTLTTREMSAPQVIDPAFIGTLMPLYPSTAGLSSKTIAKDIRAALSALGEFPDELPLSLLREFSIVPLGEALQLLHCPQTEQQYRQGRERIVFEELFIYSCAMLSLKANRSARSVKPFSPTPLSDFYDSLPFALTSAQLAAISEIEQDLCSGRVMSRMVQGDVGSGKTLIASAAILMAVRNGKQSAMMAPTEILAAQHTRTLTELLAPLGVEVLLLTGATGAKQRRETLSKLADGSAQVVVGTHALLTEDVVFSDLTLVVTDEQHRFGVSQRAKLSSKSEDVHTLVMSATPIPRTLSLVIYGDLDISVVNELPPGRQRVKTYLIDSAIRARSYRYIKDRFDEGRQAYMVVPLVEENEEFSGLLSAQELYRRLSEKEFSGYRVGLLHGKLSPRQKDKVMSEFASGEIQLLVATTVVEVGVDVPNAVVMLIENAERFGLGQLHQLRGRVGRGEYPSICVLVSDNQSPETRERLNTMCKTNDGFVIAQEDLRLRGPGDMLGLRQHGAAGLSHADLISDAGILHKAQQAANKIICEQTAFPKENLQFLQEKLHRFMRQIGERPN